MRGGWLVLLREVSAEREALRAKDELLAVVGHELRTPHEQWVRIAVVDRGAGIAPEHLPRLFERFYRVPSDLTKDAPPGFGLGLSIVRDLVEAHGGRVEVLSEGKGSTFIVVLPAPPLPPA